jgi:hypothetical protein
VPDDRDLVGPAESEHLMMTAATQSRPFTPALHRRDQVSWGDLAWLVWRQHRILILATTLGIALVAGLCWWDAANIQHAIAQDLLLNAILPVSTALVAVFWGAPLLAGEYDQGTTVFAWTQDVSPARWLVAKLVMLGATAGVLWAVLSIAERAFINAANMKWAGSWVLYGAFGLQSFESWLPMQVLYALFGFVAGIAVGVVVRRTVPSVGLTLLLFVGVRGTIIGWRPRYLPPLRYVAPPSVVGLDPPHPNDLIVGNSHSITATGAPAQIPDACYDFHTGATDAACAKANGVVATYADYQPADRLLTFHLIELGIYAVLTAALITFTVVRIRVRGTTTNQQG